MKHKRSFPEALKSKEHIFYIFSESGDQLEHDVWFVNNSDEVLSEVRGTSGGFETADDEVANRAPSIAAYNDVRPGEAVVIDMYHEIYDSDFVMQIGVEIVSPALGKLTLSSDLTKNQVQEATLYWKPLPREMRLYGFLKLVSPGKIAENYKRRSGKSLDKSVSFNIGDLVQEYAARRLKSSGLQLEKSMFRDGRVTFFQFSDETGRAVFHTTIPKRAIAFINGIKA